MIEQLIIKAGILFGVLSFPSLFKKPSAKIWLPLYLINCIVNYLFDKALVGTKKIKYPVRLLPKVFKINAVYDFLVCPFISVWFCQSTYHSKPLSILGKLFLFGLPQGIYEILLERKTNTLKFKGKWKWFYSVFLVFIVKIISQGTFQLLKLMFKNPEAQKMKIKL